MHDTKISSAIDARTSSTGNQSAPALESELESLKRAHRVSWELAVGPIPEGKCLLHKCDVPACVNPDHLSLGTSKENTADMVEKGRAASGERNGHAKLTKAQVKEILALSRQGMVQREIAARYGVARTLVSAITLGKLWKRQLNG